MGTSWAIQLKQQRLNLLGIYSSVDIIIPFHLPWLGTQQTPGTDNWENNWLAAPNAPPSASDDPPGFATNKDGRLEAFVRSSNGGAVWHLWQQSDGSLSDWASLGGSIDGGPVAAVNADGRIELFARKGGTLVHNWQLVPNGATGWSGWNSLGGSIDGQLTVGVNDDGRLEVFAKGGGHLQHIWQNSPNGGWSGWQSLGGSLDGDPTVALNPRQGQQSGRLEVFVRSGGKLAHIWQTTNGWSGWNSLGGGLSGDPIAGVNRDGRLEVFAKGNDNALWHIWQNTAGGGWSGWDSLHGNLDGDYRPAVASNYDGRLEVFAMLIGGIGESVSSNAQLAAGGWSGWNSMALSNPPTG